MRVRRCKNRAAVAAMAFVFALAVSTGMAQEEAMEAAEEIAAIDTGDTGFMFASTAMVLLMTPGLAFFYAGMVRRKNVLGAIMHSFAAMAIMSLQWVLWGYSLSFGSDIGGFVGGLNHFGLAGIGPDDVSGTIPAYLFVAFQGMFAIITPALIAGAMAERIKFSTYCVFILIWGTVVYDPICHWVWHADGWLFKMGALDFAGGTVVHMSSGFTALVIALMLGRRKGFPREPIMPHNLPFTILGAGLLWFGWFGFNAGSALAANGTAINAFLTTNTAAATAALTWMLLDWFKFKKPTALGAASGAVAGLVTITPACAFVTPLSAIAIGAIGSAVCRFVVQWRTKRGIDDSLDAFGVHGIGGMTGALLTGVFASVGSVGLLPGLFAGSERAAEGLKQFYIQGLSVAATMVYAGAASFIIFKILDAAMGLRVSDREEFEGLDLSQHGEAGYTE